MFATSTELIQHYQPQLPTMWETLLAQTDNRLKSFVTHKPLTGKVTIIDQIQKLEFTERTGRLQKTELSEMEYAKRAIYAREFSEARAFDEFDEIKLSGQRLPIAETMNEFQAAYERASEKVILEAIAGTAYTGENGNVPVELPNSQVIDLGFHRDGTTASVGLTFDKFARLRRLAMQNEAFGQGVRNGSDQLCLATNAAGIEDLYHSIYVNNKEYLTAIERVRQGEVDDFLGVMIVRTEQLDKRTVGTDQVCDNLAWIKSKVVFGTRNKYSAKMSVRDDISEAIQLRAKFAIGGARLEEKAVWKLPSKITA